MTFRIIDTEEDIRQLIFGLKINAEYNLKCIEALEAWFNNSLSETKKEENKDE